MNRGRGKEVAIMLMSLAGAESRLAELLSDIIYLKTNKAITTV